MEEGNGVFRLVPQSIGGFPLLLTSPPDPLASMSEVYI